MQDDILKDLSWDNGTIITTTMYYKIYNEIKMDKASIGAGFLPHDTTNATITWKYYLCEQECNCDLLYDKQRDL